MQSKYPKQFISLLILVLSLSFRGQSQCIPPASLSPFQCNSCNEIRVYYCENEPIPTSLETFLQQNSSYQAGATFQWYSDNLGVQGNALPSEPIVDLLYAHTEYYWVSQVVAGCESPTIRLNARVRATPNIAVADSIDFCFPYMMDLAGQVSDRRRTSSSFQYFDMNPAGGALPFQTLTASGGILNPSSQQILVAPINPQTYWVIGINEGSQNNSCTDTAHFTIVPNQIPRIQSQADISVCEGTMVNLPVIQSVPAPTLTFWTNSNPQIGLNSFGFGSPPAFQAPTGLTHPDTAFLEYFALAGPCPAIDSIMIVIHPNPQIEAGLVDTVCSRTAANLSLALQNQISGPISYQWNAPTLSGGLKGTANAGSGPVIQDMFINETGSFLSAQYSVIATSDASCSSQPTPVNVLTKPEPVISAGLDKDICSSQPANLAFSTSNGLNQVNYSWIGGSLPVGLSGIGGSPSSSSGPVLQDAFLNVGNPSLSVGYQVQATADGCQGLAQNISLTIYPINTSGSFQLSACESSSGSGQATFDLTEINTQVGGNPVDGFFRDSEFTQAIANPQAFTSGNQSIYATRQGTAPCPESWTIALQVQGLPQAPLASSAEGCQGEVFTLSPVNGSLFQFYDAHPLNNNGQLLASQASSFDTTLLIPSSQVQIWVTATDGQCESPAVLSSIQVNPLPDLFSISSNSPLCAGDDLSLIPTTANVQSYHWGSADPSLSINDSVLTVENISFAEGGMYYLEVKSDKGCSYRDSISVDVIAAPNPGLDTTINYCDGEPGFSLHQALGPQASIDGFWTGPSLIAGYVGNFDPSSMSFGTYTFNLNNHICQSPIFSQVTVDYYPIPSPTLSANSPLFEEDTLQLSANDGSQYQWSGPMGFTANGSQIIRPDISLSDSGYYYVTVSNEGDCESTDSIFVQVNEIPRTSITLGTWLEGPYDANTGLMWDSVRTLGAIPLMEPFTAMNYNMVGSGGETISPSVLQVTGPNAIVDWIFVDLRDPFDSMLTVASKVCLLQRDGDIVDLDGVSDPEFQFLPDGFYYVVLDQRNHLSIMTLNPIYFEKSGTASADFRDASFPTFGFNPRKIVGNTALMFSGDANGDDQVQVVDLVNFWVPNVGGSGYINADWNMDGQVQNIDFINMWIPNAGRGSQVPGKAL
jgi:hypothetical protein